MRIEVLTARSEMENAEMMRGKTQSKHIKALEVYLAGDFEEEPAYLDIGRFIDELESLIEAEADKTVFWGGHKTKISNYIDTFKVVWDLDQEGIISIYRVEDSGQDFAYVVVVDSSRGVGF